MAATIETTEARAETSAPGAVACCHCGSDCGPGGVLSGEQPFCCAGCRTVYEILSAHGMTRFYELDARAGVRMPPDLPADLDRFAYLDDPAIRAQLLDFTDGATARVTLQVPAIHCVACVWLLEHLYKLDAGVAAARVNFGRREVAITFREQQLSLAGLVRLLTSIGYEPALNLASRGRAVETRVARGLYLRLGVAGFAFGNIMLLSFPAYLGMTATEDPRLRALFTWITVALSVPVLCYSASEYWRAAWLCLRRRVLTIDVPIAVGLVALYAQSLWRVASVGGDTYLDSFTGLVFFLLCGKWFQRLTYERLAFDRDYSSYFPLAVTRRERDGDRPVPLTRIVAGDILLVRGGELIPCEARLRRGEGRIDYSFVTGEAEPVPRACGAVLYAGGRQTGGLLELEVLKDASQSALAALWNQEAFRKGAQRSLRSLTDAISRRFTVAVLGVAAGVAVFWALRDPSRALGAFTAVLIVACPCAIALAAPLAGSAARRVLGRHRVFIRGVPVIEAMARVDTIVFDKTGTLTEPTGRAPAFQGPPLSSDELAGIAALTQQSTHPHSVALRAAAPEAAPTTATVQAFREVTGRGLEGTIQGDRYRIGSAAWMESLGIALPPAARDGGGGHVWLAINDRARGYWAPETRYREAVATLVRALAPHYRLAVLSGDTERERPRLAEWFGEGAEMKFRAGPAEKLEFVKALQAAGRTVMMVGDGLNDAGALKQSDVGVAVSEDAAGFSPACDAILEAAHLAALPGALRLARRTAALTKVSFVISFMYNLAGVSFAAAGALSPMVCAILMPLSSVSVVAFAAGATTLAGRRMAKTA